MVLLETPSRIWRRVEEGEDVEMPSLPSLPGFDDSGALSSSVADEDPQQSADRSLEDFPAHSTPAPNTQSYATIRPSSSTSSTAKFANSLASRSTRSRMSGSLHRRDSFDAAPESFSASVIPALPEPEYEEDSLESVPDVYLPPPDEDDDYEPPTVEPTPKKNYDYSVSLRTEPKASPRSPYDKFRNVVLRKPYAAIRIPSLTHTAGSAASSPVNSTPRSGRSLALSAAHVELPRSATASPAALSRSLGSEEHSREFLDQSRDIMHLGASGPEFIEGHSQESSMSEPSFAHRSSGSNRLRHSEGHSSRGSTSQQGKDVSLDESQLQGYSLSLQDEDLPSFEEGRSPASFLDGRSPASSQRPRPTVSFHQQVSRGSTFSSEEEASTPPQANRTVTKSVSPRSTHSSPAASVAFTPTPAFNARPRARFNVPGPALETTTPAGDRGRFESEDDEDLSGEEDGPATPKTQRRSYYLAVINSVARPRLKQATPHPRAAGGVGVPQTPGGFAQTPFATPGIALKAAFAGVTPGPPLRVAPSSAGARVLDWPPQQRESPAYDAGTERASFISTASSHDLTTFHRANQSFDPLMGLGAQDGHGVGRFNAPKLNNYLHSLNHNLQKENVQLQERIQTLEDEIKRVKHESHKARRGSGGRVSLGGDLGNVTENAGEEKAELEEIIEELRTEAQQFASERDEIDKALDEERAIRAKEKDKWREKMAELATGVDKIVSELESKAKTSEAKAKQLEKQNDELVREMERQAIDLQGALDAAMERAENAEHVLESGKELGGELRAANERVGNVMADLRNANAQIKDLEEEGLRNDGRIEELEGQLHDEKDFSEKLEDELQLRTDEINAAQERISRLEGEVTKAHDELHSTKSYVAELEEDAAEAGERIENMGEEVAAAVQRAEQFEVAERDLADRVEGLERDAQRATELARRRDEALEAAEDKMTEDEEKLAQLRGRLATLERERTREEENARDQSALRYEPSQSRILNPGPTDADVEAMEDELDDANKEIARLTTLLAHSPARKAMDKAKDTKIEMLEREKEDLAERVKGLRGTVTELGTPGRLINASGMSPIHRQVLAMSMRAPKTPGGPLRDMSWLNNTGADPTVGPLVNEISRLQRELDRANQSIDDKLDRLEEDGLGVIGLTRKLEDARAKITRLEDEIARLSRREDRQARRLERLRCQKCHIKVDVNALANAAEADESSFDQSRMSLPSEPPTPPTKSSQALRANLQTVNADLERMKHDWEHEKRKLVGEKEVLQDAAKKLNGQVRDARDEVKRISETERAGERARMGIQGELDHAKRSIAELESDLQAERAQLRTMNTEQDRVRREQTLLNTQMERAESDMHTVKEQLHKFKQQNHDMEKELRTNANVDQKARLLEVRVAENMDTIDQLRQERSLLAVDYKELQRRYTETSELANRLRTQHASTQGAHDQHRHQLDLHLAEIEDLRLELSTKAHELHRTEEQKDRMASEQDQVARTVNALEADLVRVRRDAEVFGRDLKALCAEKLKLETRQKEDEGKAERSKKQLQSLFRIQTEELEAQKDKTARARSELQSHICAIDEGQLSAMKVQHKKECKGLQVRITYNNAKLARQGASQEDLVWQKKYLLVLLGEFEKTERNIVKSIARIGFPAAQLTKRSRLRKLKSVVLTVVFILRVQARSATWKKARAAQEGVNAALEDVRRRRAIAGAS